MPKAIHLLVNQMLPEHLRSNDHTYDKKDINEMVRAVSVEDPERYASFVNGLKDLGRKSVYLQGATLRLSDFEAGFDKEAIYKSMDNELAGLDLIKDDSLRLKRKMIIYGKYAEQLTDLAMKAGRAKGSSLAGIIASGARGNPAQYRAMTTTPALYTDYKDDPIDMFVRRSFAEGVRPIDFLASTFGTRKATIATKACWMQGTRVRMADLSTKNIEDIVVGDRVLGSDNAGSVAPVKVTKTFDQGMQDVYEYELGLNSSNTTYTKLRCTEDHKILQFSPKAYRKAYSQFYRGSRPTPPDDSLLNSREVLPAKELTKRYFKACIASGTYDKRQPDALSVRSFKLLGLRPCYDIEVDNDSHLFVLASGVIGSNSTADAGDLGKLLVQNGLPVMVNSKRSTTPSGILLHPDEDEIRGRVLARPAAGYAAGTVVTRKVETAIRNKHKGRVMVYSPLSEVGADGISGEAFGVNYDGVIPGPGFSAGVTAGNALSEPIAQGSLNTKHSGGAFTGGKKVFSGFDYISQFVQVPDTFKDRASVSELGGKVERIEDAPQGGKYVTVEGEKHYVLPDLEVSVNVGDTVEPGDALSDGLINPRDVIRLRGLGEGRRYYSRRLKQMLDDSGQAAQLRNTEVIARGALDAVQIGDDGHMGYLPDSVVSYNKLEAEWVPRKDAESRLTRQSEGRYLEAPLLHYTIGTKLTSRMLDEIQEAGFDSINSHNKPPPFEPIQIRLRTNSYEVNPDWLARTGSSYLQKNLSESAQRGYDTNLKENTHPLPRLAVGVNFGDKIKETGKF